MFSLDELREAPELRIRAAREQLFDTPMTHPEFEHQLTHTNAQILAWQELIGYLTRKAIERNKEKEER